LDPCSPDLGAKGLRLWRSLHQRVDGERGLILLEEACRISDRLDKLNALLLGDADVWCRLLEDMRSDGYELRIDSALVEARQQANTLRQLVASLPLRETDDGDDDGWLDAGVSP
jgi:hypothetical protein